MTRDGRIVWEWKAGDHLDEFGFTPEGFEYMRRSVARQPDNIWATWKSTVPRRSGPTTGTVTIPTRSSSPKTS